MRHISLIVTTFALTACSFGEYGTPQPVYHNTQPAHYGASYKAQAHCAPLCLPYGQPHHAPMPSYNMAPVQHNYALQSHAPSYSATNAPNLRGPYSPYDNPHAARGYKYASAGAVLYDFDSELYGIQGRAGYQSAGLFGGELEASIGLSTDSSQLGTATVTRDIDYSIAAFGVARIPLNEKINFLGRAGLHSTRVADTFEDGATLLSSADTDAGLAFGIGVEYALSSRNSLRLDHTRYDLDAGGADSVSLAFATKF